MERRMVMGLRFITNMLLALAGGFLVVASQAFSAGTTGWIAFGVGLGIITMLGVSQVDRGRGTFQRALDAVGGLIAMWTIVASVVFVGAALTWLSFGEGLAFVA